MVQWWPLLLALGGVLTQQTRRRQACDESSCYPATGDLLIGRKDKLSTSSTCGLRRHERFCIVSHLEDVKKCFYCDSRRPWAYQNPRSHKIENIVHDFNIRRKFKWWQAENGMQNVYIQLDLEAEFHFTHLVMTFKTFRPAAMLIERSSDFGRTWKTYRYFAQDCARSFPGVSTGPVRQLSDVICTDQYSDVAPSTGGEVIFRVLPPFIQIDNPYSSEVQDLLKLTNLRVNFTRLHTLGDNLLDSRDAIKEKYYYAMYEMVVRGSCSCYGHASRCLPLPGQQEEIAMVYGRCECTHNTKGLNCEQCEDFYNDLPWRPARGSETNACKRCECNNHAARCYFDAAAYAASGNVSGGVCDDCRHNTMGKNCELCKPFFYRDPRRQINDPYVCQPCDCDPFGSQLNGECQGYTDEANNLVAGRCICKTYVTGQRCDTCVNGYWNLTESNVDGCQPCSCNTLGTIGNEGCDKRTGECNCKRFVSGRDCDACLQGYWGLSEDLNGCNACDCDVGGAYNNDCNQATGQCDCKPNIVNRRCNAPQDRYFAPYLDFHTFEAEFERASGNAQVMIREPIPGRPTTWTGPGFMRVFEGDSLLVEVKNLPASMEYDIVIRYEPQLPERWDDVRVTVIRPKDVDQSGVCANTIPQDDTKVAPLLPDFEDGSGEEDKILSERHHTRYGQDGNIEQVYNLYGSYHAGGRYVKLRPSSCLEKDATYQIKLDFTRYKSDKLTPDASVLIDSIVLVPHTDDIPFFSGSYENERRRREFERYRCLELQLSVNKPPMPEICKQYVFSISTHMYGRALDCDCDPMGSTSAECEPIGGQCSCKKNVIGRRCDQCAPGTYGFGPDGCTPCLCNPSGSRDNFCDVTTGQCLCRTNAYGRACDECERGFYGFPSCRPCRCNGRAETCHPQTGECEGCSGNTAGFSCDRCARGYYGDPRRGSTLGCRPCLCPGGNETGVQHAETCRLDRRTDTVICDCEEGYQGPSCDKCAENYYGNPTVPGGVCRPCTCNNNIDTRVPGSCDPDTGECLKCLYNTEGFNCEHCKPGYYGDATQQSCEACVCNMLGTNRTAGPCDRRTGQCPCLPNVVGLRCDRCAADHWKLASGRGCDHCRCDPEGSLSSQCNEFDGQCQCRQGRGGRTCSECETNYWGDPNQQCFPCECNVQGSATMQCNRQTGACECQPGVTGYKCDRCDRGTTGELPNCKPCHECFDNWDKVIMELKNETDYWVRRGSDIKIKGVIGAFDKEFEAMENMLEEVKRIVSGANVTSAEVEQIKQRISDIRRNLTINIDVLNHVDEEIGNTTKRIGVYEKRLESLRIKINQLKRRAEELRQNATNIKETDVTGAYNITLEAQRRSREAQQKVDLSERTVQESERRRRLTEELIVEKEQEFRDKNADNNRKITEINVRVERLTGQIVDINEKVCDKRGDPCDPVCGGGGCGKCGGTGCSEGAVEKAKDAMKLATDGERELLEKRQQAEDILRDITDAEGDSNMAKSDAQMAYDRAVEAKNQSVSARVELETIIDRIRDFLTQQGAKPTEIRAVAQEVLNMTIQHTPDEVDQLAREINKTLEGLKNIDDILESTRVNVEEANNLKSRANNAKNSADEILKTANRVIDLLREADAAQTDAQSAIDKADQDIQDAEQDLNMIEEQTRDGRNISRSTVEKTDDLSIRVDRLKRQFTQNKIAVEKAESEANSAKELADQAELKKNELDDRHEKVETSVDIKFNETVAARARATRLRERAEKIYKETNDKVESLRRMEREFVDNEKQMKDISEEINKLNREMDELIIKIQQRTEFHRNC